MLRVLISNRALLENARNCSPTYHDRHSMSEAAIQDKSGCLKLCVAVWYCRAERAPDGAAGHECDDAGVEAPVQPQNALLPVEAQAGREAHLNRG